MRERLYTVLFTYLHFYARFLALLVFILGLGCSANAQPSKVRVLDSLVTVLDSTVEEHIADHRSVSASMGSTRKLVQTFRADDHQSEKYQNRLEILNSRREILQNDFGLDLEAGYLENFSTGLFNVEGIFYKRRANIGLEWNILKNGWIDHHYELQALDREKQAFQKSAREFIPDRYFKNLQVRIDKAFRDEKSDILRAYLGLLNSREKISIALYHHNYLKWDAILALTSKKARIQRLLQSTQQLNDEISLNEPTKIEYRNLPVVDIHLQSLLEAVARQGVWGTGTSHSIVPDYHPLTDISLSASVQYNFYSNAPEERLTGATGKREFVSAGINVSVPLPLQVEEKNNLAAAERREKELDIKHDKQDRRQRIYDLYEQYKQLLGEYERDFKSYKMYNEQLRIHQTKERLDDASYSPRDVAEILADRYSKRLELLNNHQQMYEVLTQIFSLTYQTPLQKYINPVNFLHSGTDITKRMGVKPLYNKSIYIWSSTFDKYDNQALVKYLKGQSFDTIFLSPGPDPQVQKVNDFVKKAHDSAISVEWMVGSNQLIHKPGESDIASEIRAADEVNADGIHLDVEPQTFDDWDENKDRYKKDYLEMTKMVSAEALNKNLSLSISVPVYFDSIVPELANNVNNMQLMAYGTDDVNHIQKRVKHEANVAVEKVAIALRPEDITDGESFKKFVENLQNELSISRFSIHDLEALLTSQNATIKSDH